LILRRLREGDRREGFRSGEHSLDDFFERHAWNNHTNNISRVYVAVEEEEEEEDAAEVLGYVTLGAAEIQASKVAEHLPMPLPQYPMPAFKVGRLAVQESQRGRGIGTQLLRHAFETSLALAEHVAALGILVDALNPDVVSFYERLGFIQLPPVRFPQTMFIPLDTVRAAVNG